MVKGSVAVRNFLAPRYYGQRAVFASLWALFFHFYRAIYKSLFTIQYGRNDNEKIKNKKTFTANYYTL